MINGHGDDIYRYQREIVSNFSSNVLCEVDLTPLKALLSQRLECITNYPEPIPYSLEERLTEKLHISRGEICVTNGATEAIYLIAQTFRETNSAILAPTFCEYADACQLHSHKIVSLYELTVIPEEIRMVWICNPNNPTGTVIKKQQLIELIKRYPQVCFVIDQAYEFFTLKPLLNAAEAIAYPNVILIHSMTKHFAIPGLRLGYITASENLLNRIRAHRMPWSVNSMAIEAGHFLIDHNPLKQFDLPAFLERAQQLKAALEATQCIEIWPTDVHFMLCQLRMGNASALKDYLANEHGILIRNASNFAGLNNRFFRVASQTGEENLELVRNINKWIEI